MTASGTWRSLVGAAEELRMPFTGEELADLIEKEGFGEREVDAVAKIFELALERRRDQSVQTLLRLSRLPQREPKTFEAFDFDRLQGKDAGSLKSLPALANMNARKNIAFIGPGGIGKTHLAQAYGRQCCLNGYKTYYIKATELKDRLIRSIRDGNTARAVNSLVKPSCLIVDEIGRCSFDRRCTDLFFDVVDRRYEKEGPNAMILTSNVQPVNWEQFFEGEETLVCMLDRIFDRATVFLMKGPSYRGDECETLSVEAKAMMIRSTR